MNQLPTIATDIVQSFHYCLADEIFTAEQGLMAAGVMFQLAQLRQYSERKARGMSTPEDDKEAERLLVSARRALAVLAIPIALPAPN